MNQHFIASLAFSFLVGCSSTDPTPPVSPPGLSAELRTDLQATLDGVVADGSAPGAALHVSGGGESWSGAAGVADIDGALPMAPDDHYRAGSIMKILVATAVLQSVEAGTLELDDLLTERLPPEVTGRIAHAGAIDIGMLLGHRSGIPDWIVPAVRQAIVTDPAHVWSLDDIITHVEGQTPPFAPGESFAYSNTNYVLLGEILTAVEGRSWREVLRERVIARAGMADTSLPESGDVECPGCAHGYIDMNGDLTDFTRIDPSMAGASGGHALVTTTADLVRLLEQLRAGALFDREETRDAMFAIQPAIDGGDAGGHLVGYGLGVMQLETDAGLVLGHLGGTAGYVGFMLHIPSTDRYVSGFINVMGDPGALALPTIERVARP